MNFTASPVAETHSAPAISRRTATLAVAVCWLFVVFDGYDLIVYGTVIGSLQHDWGIGPGAAGTLGSLAFLGMMIGAVTAGRLSDTIGRSRAVIGCAVVLSVFTAACHWPPGRWYSAPSASSRASAWADWCLQRMPLRRNSFRHAGGPLWRP